MKEKCYSRGMSEEHDARKQKILEKVKNFTLMDDDFMTRFFENDLEATSFLLQTILQKPELKALESISQYTIKNLQGRSSRLDIKATDAAGTMYDIEIQRSDDGAGVKRARYYSSIIDSDFLLPGKKTETLPETYVIFITEHDVLKGDQPVYHIERTVAETGKPFGDGTHIVFVNSAYAGESPVAELMHDFKCSNPDDMKIKLLADKARYFKENDKGVQQMCRAVEELINDEKREIIVQLIKEGTFTLGKIAKVCNVSIEYVEKVKATMNGAA